MEKLIEDIEKLKKSKVKRIIDKRMKEFENVEKSKIFSEICFCILTANSSAERCIHVQKHAEDCFENLPQEELAKKLKKHGARFHNKRAGYIVEAREKIKKLNSVLKKNSKKAREWLVENIKGYGMKEASHFLRNVGFKDIAIIDFHIIDLLVKHDLIKKPKTLTKKKYLEIEKLLKKISDRTNLNLAELDLYLWYMETGKILK